MSTEHFTETEQARTERWATKRLSTPVSFIGAYYMIWGRLGHGPTSGWRNIVRLSSVAMLLFLFWMFVTLEWYIIVVGSIIGAFLWYLYTQTRRHRIHDARRRLGLRDH